MKYNGKACDALRFFYIHIYVVYWLEHVFIFTSSASKTNQLCIFAWFSSNILIIKKILYSFSNILFMLAIKKNSHIKNWAKLKRRPIVNNNNNDYMPIVKWHAFYWFYSFIRWYYIDIVRVSCATIGIFVHFFYWSPNSHVDSVPIIFVVPIVFVVVVVVNFDSTIEICFELFVYLNRALIHTHTHVPKHTQTELVTDFTFIPFKIIACRISPSA